MNGRVVLRWLLAIAICVVPCAGCVGRWYRTFPAPWARTFVTQKVHDGQPTRGFPFVHHEKVIFQATWECQKQPGEFYTTQHLGTVPSLYAIDAERAFMGVTKATFETRDDGTLKSGEAEIDQKVPEVISAVGDVIESIGAILPESRHAGTTAQDPDIKPLNSGDRLVSIDIIPLAIGVCGGPTSQAMHAH